MAQLRNIGRVTYVEPNVDGGTKVWPLEDYSISVNLVVVVPKRSFNGNVTASDGILYNVSAEMSKSQFSFNNGSAMDKIYHGVDNAKVYKHDYCWTTAPYEYTTIKDFENDTIQNPECFGIQSIDIAYDNYSVPTVTIKFVDIKGISLFGAEEMRHNLSMTNADGVKMKGGVNTNIEGSFFKSFFSFPYPKYTLYVKGFYGKGTSYELTCSDFKADFDCNTGNFNATAKFVGYAFSLLNDVSMNALMAAPYELNYGRDWWAYNVKKGNFVIPRKALVEQDPTDNSDSPNSASASEVFAKRDPNALPTLGQLIDEWNQLSFEFENVSGNTSIAVTDMLESTKTIKGKMEVLKNYVDHIDKKTETTSSYDGDDFVIEITENTKEIKELKEQWEKQWDDKLKGVVGEIVNKCKEAKGRNAELSTIIGCIKEQANSYTIDKGCVGSDELYEKATKMVEQTKVSLKTLYGINYICELEDDLFDVSFSWSFLGWGGKTITIENYKKFLKAYSCIQTITDDDIQQVKDNVESAKQEQIEKALGFKPSAEVIMKILLAHLDTLNHCIYKTAQAVNSDRTLDELGIRETDIELKNGVGVGAFPRVLQNVSDADETDTTLKECWIGDLCEDKELAPEIKLVEGLLGGIKHLQEVIARHQKKDTTEEGGENEEGATTSSDSEARRFGEDANKDIKSSLYKYCKNLYDRWLSGNDEKNYRIYNTLSHFRFIDAYYKNVAYDINIDLNKMCGNMIDCFNQSSYSLLSFMSTIYSENQFSMHTVQNWLDLTNGKNLVDLFTPIPYSEYIKTEPSFTMPFIIFIYTYEPSSKLNDGFDLDDNNTAEIPQSIMNTELKNTIPAFGVSYSQQNQSYFTNISVGMEAPIVTEQVINAQFNIAALNNPLANDSNQDVSNGKAVTVVGQDLYTIYSNNSYTCEVDMLGCAYIQPLMYFQLNNIPLFHGAYLVETVNHHIEPGNMTTHFKGVRMAKVASPIVTDWQNIYNNGSGSEYGGFGIDEGYANATIDNECDYKVFPVSSEGKTDVMTTTEFNMTLAEYARIKGAWSSKITSTFNVNHDKIAELITSFIVQESGKNNEDLMKCQTEVMYNAWIREGKNLTKIFGQGTFPYIDGKQSSPLARRMAEEFFLRQGGTAALGAQAIVKHPCTIYLNGKPTDKKTYTKQVTLEDAPYADGYKTTLSYDLTWKPSEAQCNSSAKMKACVDKHGCTRKAAGCAQWIGNSSGKPGDMHMGAWRYQYDVDASATQGGCVVSYQYPSRKYWEVQTPSTQGDGGESEKYKNLKNGLFSALKSTLSSCDDQDYKNTVNEIEMVNKAESISTDSLRTFYITCKASTKDKGATLSRVFDVLLNGYGQYCLRLQWIIKNDTSEAPCMILVKVCDGNSNTKGYDRKIRKMNSEDLIKFNKQTNINENFLKSLKKRNKKSEEFNTKKDFWVFQQNYPNFADLDLPTVTEILNRVELSPCGFSGPIVVGEGDLRPQSNGAKVKGEFDVKEACKAAVNYTFEMKNNFNSNTNVDVYHGECTGGPRRALLAGFRQAYGPSPSNGYWQSSRRAYNFLTELPKRGWEVVAHVPSFPASKRFLASGAHEYMKTHYNYVPQEGDICLSNAEEHQGGSPKGSHGQIYLGGYWISDCVQKTNFVVHNHDDHLHILRYTKKDGKHWYW